METITKIQLKLKVREEKERYFGRGSHFSFVDRDVVSAHDNETRSRRHFRSSSSSELEMTPIRLYSLDGGARKRHRFLVETFFFCFFLQ